MAAALALQFHFLHDRFFFPNRTELKTFLMRLFRKEKRTLEHVNYIFCSDAYLLNLNQDYLKHKTLTDIITFELSGPGDDLIADIYISVERVRENAGLYKSTFQKELHRVIFHGALHCCGYKDKTALDQLLMREKEDHYLDRYFVPRGTSRTI